MQLTLPERCTGYLVLVPNPPQHPQGDFALQAGLVQESGAPRRTYSGIGVFSATFFDGCRDGRFPLLPLLQRAIGLGQLGGELYQGIWHDVGTVQRLAELNAG
jgi:MurNAc alpha-1-phosphate uridylyltransferase